MESRQVRVEALIIGKEKMNVIINVPKSATDSEATAYGYDYLRKQYPAQYAKDTILEKKITLIEEPKPEPVKKLEAPVVAPDAIHGIKPETDIKGSGKRGRRDLETSSRKQVKERLHQVTA